MAKLAVEGKSFGQRKQERLGKIWMDVIVKLSKLNLEDAIWLAAANRKASPERVYKDA